MKLTVIGGGGVRTPLLIKSILRRGSQLQLEHLCLMDINQDKLEMIGALVKELLRQSNNPFELSTTTDPETALAGANYIITTIRVGGDEGRILDERIALRHGVLGQETTGPGGFAMALRSIPAILNYARLIEKICPQAWVFNFTNPAGLVTQALRDAGFERIVGICDGANLGQTSVAAWMGIDPEELRTEVYGLNHLSWTRTVCHGETDLLPNLLADDDFLKNTNLNLFTPELVRQIGMYLNEYLYYYYYREDALRQINAKEKTRGEQVAEINHQMLAELKQIDYINNPALALEAYYSFNDRRVGTYMDFSRFSDSNEPIAPHFSRFDPEKIREMEEDGYAGVALNIIQAFETGKPLHTALNVPNKDSIIGLQYDDVVEVSCCVDQDGIDPLFIGEVPESHLLLMKIVKYYEKMTSQAILSRSRKQAVEGLMYHPLVLSYPLACQLVDEYLQAHAAYIGEWD